MSQGLGGECVPAGDRVRYARPSQKLIILSLTIDVARAKNLIAVSHVLHFVATDCHSYHRVAGSKLV